MSLQPITPQDSRVEHKTTKVLGYNVHYLYAVPASGQFKATVFLIHGWPDLSLGWRYQIPLLLGLGFRVVAPDLMGFGGTDAPPVPPNPINLYGLKQAANIIAALAKHIEAPQIVLGGHDWGGFVVWRTAQWHPDLVSHVFSVCTPYAAPQKEYHSIEQLIAGPLPQFGYQIHLASGEIEKIVKDEPTIRQFLKAIYGGRGPNRESAFDPTKGVLLENLPVLGDAPLLSGEVLDYYVKEYSRHGIHPTLNWYRTRKANWEEDLGLIGKETITTPSLFIQATEDSVLKPSMSLSMDTFFTQLTRGEVAASHWALTQAPVKVNQILKDWLEAQGLVQKEKSTL